ncbi:MAG: FAD-dependent oxidoreductase [Clostridiaceae bacterium]|nr:FAD-dependent oxidoreductase [Clostridiaceae bacterium]
MKIEDMILTPDEAFEKYSANPVDIAIIGGGPAGYSAAINARTRGRSALILSADYKNSYLFRAGIIDNMPGMPGISGADLLESLREHALSMGAEETRAQVLMVMPMPIDEKKTIFQVAFGTNIISANTVILSTGVSAFKAFEGEERFLGRGVSYCATCDGMLYRNKSVAIIAKAADALEEARHLKKIGCKVHFFASAADMKKWFSDIQEGEFDGLITAASYIIEGETGLSGVKADGKSYPVDGVFILRASIAPTTLAPGIELIDNYIRTDRSQATSIQGMYAAGDCTGKPLQIAKALGEGLVAALSADAHITAVYK